MSGSLSRAILPLALLAGFPARAAVVDVSVSDTRGRPAGNAVVTLAPAEPSKPIGSHLPNEAVIDQRKETFVPLVTIVRREGRVVFTNNDTTIHQVYSFSPIKQFEFEIDRGQRSPPVVFEKAGVASIGCNIHDHMITYVYVADTPWAVLTDEKGHAELRDVPAGRYRATVWHPQLVAGRSAPSAVLDVDANANLALSIDLVGTRPARRLHMGSY